MICPIVISASPTTSNLPFPSSSMTENLSSCFFSKQYFSSNVLVKSGSLQFWTASV
eukprot:CAMPEP_0202969088 /NCGR_PEP_ID=MMETSP1396-20130829/14695_1 /ASSEMBLY_ACC=CAM_ASM_000872 /TAXON_ID= /ORGANISM="Pseudokeronopsis sp., Strain Brazil" /LENGTH=55 /DNA_ID=CAMNT_0049696217 /DNA_START=82 /DNA_END=246 /DNA_ORIENTATION=-